MSRGGTPPLFPFCFQLRQANQERALVPTLNGPEGSETGQPSKKCLTEMKCSNILVKIKEKMVCYSCNMLYSTACEYAIRAMAYLARQPKNKFSPLEEIVRYDGLRAPFLAKTLLQLVKQRLVVSQKGPGGGFSLAKKPKEICLLDIVQTIDGEPDFTRCAVGLAKCSSKMPCPLHDSWLNVRTSIRKYLETQTLDKLAKAVEKKLEYLQKNPKSRV